VPFCEDSHPVLYQTLPEETQVISDTVEIAVDPLRAACKELCRYRLKQLSNVDASSEGNVYIVVIQKDSGICTKLGLAHDC
jgi:hypothetical protein